jgi:AcrR family transcriptional regulator
MPKAIDENRVFEVAAALFVSHGYAGTKTKEIAEAAGVNEATLFRRYGSKAALLGKAIYHQWRDVPLAGLSASDDLEADLLSIVEAYLETNRLRGAIIPALLAELARSAELRGAFDSALANVGRLVSILVHHQTAGRLRTEEPMTMLMALIGPLLVHEMFRRTGIGAAASTIDTRAYVRAFLEGRGCRSA